MSLPVQNPNLPTGRYSLYEQYSGSATPSDLTKADLQQLIQLGEGVFLEFKQRISSPEKIAREMAAFANTQGGIILVGVADNGKIIGLESYLEEEFYLQTAASELCKPAVDLNIQIINVGKKDVLMTKVSESGRKPVSILMDRQYKVFLRVGEESLEASPDQIEIMKRKNSDQSVTFEYGENEQKLFRFLNEYGEITVQRLADLIPVTTFRASRILVNLTAAGVLTLFNKNGVDIYTFAKRNSQPA